MMLLFQRSVLPFHFVSLIGEYISLPAVRELFKKNLSPVKGMGF